MKDLVSILILSYKNVDDIFETLDSIFMQDYENIEIVISDDGTPDFKKYVEKLQKYTEQKSNSNIKNIIINSIEINGGTVKNINSAIAKSNGKYIKVLAAEDALSSADAISKYVEYMSNNDVKIAFAKMRGVTPEGEYKYEMLACESDYDLLKSYTPEQTRKRLYRRNFLPAPAWIIDRTLFEKYGMFPEDTRLIEDYPYWLYLSMEGVKFGYIDEILIEYKCTGISSAGNYSEMFMNDMLVIYNKYIFPYDKRFGIFQPLYNFLKKSGLNFYMAKARWGKMNKKQQVIATIKYFPFMMFVKLQNIMINHKNKKAIKKN